MKKAMIVILALLLLLTGLFFWKGGHHAIVLAEHLEEWLDADDGDQSLTVLVQIPGFQTDNGALKPEIRQLQMTGRTFWTEYADRRLFGLTSQGMTAWTDGENLYMDTGKAYALPGSEKIRKLAKELTWGLLLHGRVAKDGDTYEISMKTEELELYADFTADQELRSASIMAVLPDETAVHASLTTEPAVSHAVPEPVRAAMVRAVMEPPMALSEPLEVLLPALEQLLPLEGKLKLGVECGILKLSETVDFSMDGESARIQRKGAAVTLPLPFQPEALTPLPAAMLLLRNGEFVLDGKNAVITVSVPAEATGELCAALIPQIGELGMLFGESTAVLTLSDGRLSAVTMEAAGDVPFLGAKIPVEFGAELMIE